MGRRWRSGLSVRSRSDWGIDCIDFCCIDHLAIGFFVGTNRRIHRLFGVTVFPSYVILGADGMIRERMEGYGPETAAELESKIRKSLKASVAK